MQQQEQHSVPSMVDDWSDLNEVIDSIRYALTHCMRAQADDGTVILSSDSARTLLEYVPKLFDRYSELLELSHVMTSAWEKLNASKNDLYVPDAQEMVQSAGLKDRP